MSNFDFRVRLAQEHDSNQLAQLNWDYAVEEKRINEESFETYKISFDQFFQAALVSDNWVVWVAESSQKLVCMVYVQVIHKVRRPGKSGKFAYITNVYTVPERRNQGIGTAVLKNVIEWAQTQNLQFLILWPSEKSFEFYKRLGFKNNSDNLELRIP